MKKIIKRFKKDIKQYGYTSSIICIVLFQITCSFIISILMTMILLICGILDFTKKKLKWFFKFLKKYK